MEYAIKHNGQYESIPFNQKVVQTHGKGSITLNAKLNDNAFVKCNTISPLNQIVRLHYPSSVTLKLISKKPFSYTIPGYEPRYQQKRKIEDFLYEITYGNIDYDYALKYFIPLLQGECSAVRNGNFFGRNFDWLYNNEVQFVVHTPSSFDRYAVLGVSGIIPGIEQSNVDQDDIIIDGVDMFKLVPFYLLDGINEKGLFCTHNVVPLDNDIAPTREIKAKIEEKYRIAVPMLPRFILDFCANAKQALKTLIGYTTIYFTDEMLGTEYQSHFLIGDKTHTYVIEFIDNYINVLRAPFITNFNISNVIFAADKTILYPPTQYGINKFGSGLERWNLIAENYKQAGTLDGMRQLMGKIKYSNMYQEPFWYSEIVKSPDDAGDIITVDTPPDLCNVSKNLFKYNYSHKDRNDPKVWITCHSAIYDIRRKIIYVTNQENTTEYSFQM